MGGAAAHSETQDKSICYHCYDIVGHSAVLTARSLQRTAAKAAADAAASFAAASSKRGQLDKGGALHAPFEQPDDWKLVFLLSPPAVETLDLVAGLYQHHMTSRIHDMMKVLEDVPDGIGVDLAETARELCGLLVTRTSMSGGTGGFNVPSSIHVLSHWCDLVAA
jgi:hypothetical protein